MTDRANGPARAARHARLARPCAIPRRERGRTSRPGHPLGPAILVILALAAPVLGAGAERIERLENGLRVIVKERPFGQVAAFRIYLQAGSLNEGEFTGAGISHLLEHVVSGGTTANRTEDEIREALDRIGAQTNAHTSKQYVCYHGQAGAEHVDELIELISDYVMHCVIDPDEFAREHQVVQRELERAEVNPAHVLWNLAAATFFVDHPARHPILGHLEILQKLTRDDAHAYYRRVARPDNAVAVAVGDFDADEVLATIRRLMGAWERRKADPTVLPDRVRQTAPRFASRAMDVAGVRRTLEFPTVRLTHPDLYPLDILAFVLGEGRSSRLVADLREKRVLVQSVGCYSYTPAGYDGGSFVVYLVGDPEKAEAAREAALGHVARVAEEGITEEELARAKRQKIAEHVYRLEETEAIAADMGTSFLLVGNPHFSDTYVEAIQKVTADEVRRVARDYLRPQVRTETVIHPPDVEPKASPGAAEAASAKGARPEIEMRRLASGVRLLLCPVPDHPSVSIQMCMKGGLALESAETAGASRMLAHLLMKGTGDLDAAALARRLDTLGADLSASAGNNTMMLSARCLAGDWADVFDLAARSLVAPSLPDEEIERVRARMLVEIDQLDDTPRGEAQRFFHEVYFTDSPYRFPVQGRAEVVRDLDRAALEAWHTRIVTGENLVVAVFGGIDPEAVATAAEKAFAKLPKAFTPAVPPEAAPRKVEAREVHVQATEKPGAVVFVAYPGFDLHNVDARIPMKVLDTLVSGYRMPGGWLHEELRGRGLVYVVHAYAMAGLRPGYFAAYAMCQAEKVPEVVSVIEEKMARARTEQWTADQLAPARATIITAEALGRETIAGWAFEAALNECLCLGYAFARREIDLVRAVTPDDVHRVAERYLGRPVIAILTSDPAAAETLKPKK